jgi:hypothetical protein
MPRITGAFQLRVRKNGRGRERGKVPGPGLALVKARTHVLLDACNPRPTNGQEPFLHRSHLTLAAAPHSHSHPPRAPPTTTFSSPASALAAALAPTARPSHHHVLPARLSTHIAALALALAPATHPSHHDAPRLPRHPTVRCGTRAVPLTVQHDLLGDPRPVREQRAEPRVLMFFVCGSCVCVHCSLSRDLEIKNLVTEIQEGIT